MGLLDEIGAQLAGVAGVQRSDHAGMANAVLDTFARMDHGGLPGLVQTFHDQGLGAVISSWIGPGQNLSVSAEQIQKVFGDARVQQLAQRAGIAPDVAAAALAKVLPTLVDKLTPTGTMESGSLQGRVDALRKLL